MSFIHQQPRAADFILSEANGYRSRANIIINAGAGILAAGTVLALLTAANAGVVTAKAGNTGNGVFGSVTASNAAITGTYDVSITAAEAGAGTFTVTDPNGDVVGEGTVGTQFSAGGLTFTIADGADDFAEGDGWTVAVNAGLGEWVAYDDDGANDGRRAATGVLYASVDASERDVAAVAIVRDAEVAGALLIGSDAAAVADLLALGVLVRT